MWLIFVQYAMPTSNSSQVYQLAAALLETPGVQWYLTVFPALLLSTVTDAIILIYVLLAVLIIIFCQLYPLPSDAASHSSLGVSTMEWDA